MAKREESVAAVTEKKLRRRLQKDETAYLKAQQQLEAAQARLSKAQGRLERRASAVARTRAALVDLVARRATAVIAPVETSPVAAPGAATSTEEVAPPVETSPTEAPVTTTAEEVTAPAVAGVDPAESLAGAPAASQPGESAQGETASSRPRSRRPRQTAPEAATQPLVSSASDAAAGDQVTDGEGMLGVVVP